MKVFLSLSLRATALFVLSTTLPTTASAQNLVINGSFENPVVGHGSFVTYGNGSTDVPGWAVTGTNVLLIDSDYAEPAANISAFTAQEGSQSFDLTGSTNNGAGSGLRQTILTLKGTRYTMSFYVGCVRSSTASYYTTPSTVNLAIDAGAATGYTNSNVTINGIDWQRFTASFVATGSSTTLEFTDGTPHNNFVGLDNVSVQAVPEPTSLAALGVGALALLRRRKR